VEPDAAPGRPRAVSAPRRLAGLLALAAAGLVACGGQVITAGEVTVLVSERTGAGMDALGGGTLGVVGGCLGADGSVIVWPHGTEVVDEDPLTIEVPGYGTFAVGDQVQVGGGYVRERSHRAERGPFDVAGVTVPSPCAAHDVFLAR
jgi:hypothetical protein